MLQRLKLPSPVAPLRSVHLTYRVKIAGILLVIAAICAAGATGLYLVFSSGGDSTPPRPADGSYTNAKMRYTFAYPTSWDDVSDLVKLQLPEGATATILDQVAVGNVEPQTGLLNGALVSVVKLDHTVKVNDMPAELKALDQVFQQQAAAVSGVLEPPQDGDLGGLPARQYIIKFVYQGDEAASAQTVTFFGDRQYTVNCQGRASSFSKDVLPGCEQLVQSFRFK
jgi:hypothetical protein